MPLPFGKLFKATFQTFRAHAQAFTIITVVIAVIGAAAYTAAVTIGIQVVAPAFHQAGVGTSEQEAESMLLQSWVRSGGASEQLTSRIQTVQAAYKKAEATALVAKFQKGDEGAGKEIVNILNEKSPNEQTLGGADTQLLVLMAAAKAKDPYSTQLLTQAISSAWWGQVFSAAIGERILGLLTNPLFWVAVIASAVILMWVFYAVQAFYVQLALGKHGTAGIVRQSLWLAPKFFVQQLFVWLFLAWPALLGVLLVVASGGSLFLLALIGFIAAVVMAAIFGPRFMAMQVLLVRDKHGIVESIKKSYHSTRGYWWKIVGNSILWGLSVGIASAVIRFMGTLLLGQAAFAIPLFLAFFLLLLWPLLIQLALLGLSACFYTHLSVTVLENPGRKG